MIVVLVVPLEVHQKNCHVTTVVHHALIHMHLILPENMIHVLTLHMILDMDHLLRMIHATVLHLDIEDRHPENIEESITLNVVDQDLPIVDVHHQESIVVLLVEEENIIVMIETIMVWEAITMHLKIEIHLRCSAL